jgi:hypothetical protein
MKSPQGSVADAQNIDAEIGHYIILSPTSITNGARAREREILTTMNRGLQRPLSLKNSEIKKMAKDKQGKGTRQVETALHQDPVVPFWLRTLSPWAAGELS